jgi:uncharacterized protein (TIGR02284 family)
MVNKKSIHVLNTLIEINNDRIEGYDTALRETENDDLKTLFSQLIQTSEECKTQLRNEVLRLGGTPIAGTTTGGMLFSVWMDVKSALTRQDHKGILKSCEDGEDIAVHAYENVLKTYPEDITTPQRTLLHSQLQLIENDRNKIRESRDKLVNA